MNLEEEKIKIAKAIARLEMDADDMIMKDFSEAYRYSAEILKDYLRYLNRGKRPITSPVGIS